MSACIYCGGLCIDPHEEDGCQNCNRKSWDEPRVVLNDDDVEVSRCNCRCHWYDAEPECEPDDVGEMLDMGQG